MSSTSSTSHPRYSHLRTSEGTASAKTVQGTASGAHEDNGRHSIHEDDGRYSAHEDNGMYSVHEDIGGYSVHETEEGTASTSVLKGTASMRTSEGTGPAAGTKKTHQRASHLHRAVSKRAKTIAHASLSTPRSATEVKDGATPSLSIIFTSKNGRCRLRESNPSV